MSERRRLLSWSELSWYHQDGTPPGVGSCLHRSTHISGPLGQQDAIIASIDDGFQIWIQMPRQAWLSQHTGCVPALQSQLATFRGANYTMKRLGEGRIDQIEHGIGVATQPLQLGAVVAGTVMSQLARGARSNGQWPLPRWGFSATPRPAHVQHCTTSTPAA